MSHPTTKQELLHRIRARHADMEELLSSLEPAQMRAPELDGGWSVKDSLAHIAAWEKVLLD
ncbi:ClbS/DfsB family four-helix bundle protein, partial [Anaerolineae bacterium CFX7]|nr:ClbS/DfsB family four-helix bundle protein [Anaerolineae bacterium CFX7]